MAAGADVALALAIAGLTEAIKVAIRKGIWSRRTLKKSPGNG